MQQEGIHGQIIVFGLPYENEGRTKKPVQMA